MPSSSDILAGRAAVELVIDKSQLRSGMAAAASELKSAPAIDSGKLDAAVSKMSKELDAGGAATQKIASTLQTGAAPAAQKVSQEASKAKAGLDGAAGSSRNLKAGLDEAASVTKNIDRNVASMRAGMIASQAAIGLQDFMQVYELTGDIGRSLSAVMNNAIQVFSLINPWAGAIAAAVIAGYQLYRVFDDTAGAAKRAREEQERGAKAAEEWAKAAQQRGDKTFDGVVGAIRPLKDQKDADEKLKDLADDRDWAEWELDVKDWEVTDAWTKMNADPKSALARKEWEEAVKAKEEAAKKLHDINAQIDAVQKRRKVLPEISEERKTKAEEEANKEAEREREKKERESEQWREKNQRETQAIRERYETPDERAARQLNEIDSHSGFFGNGLTSEEAQRARDQIEKERVKANKLLEGAEEGQKRVRGTFSGSALSGLGGSADRQLKASESTAKNTEKMIKKLDKLTPPTWR